MSKSDRATSDTGSSPSSPAPTGSSAEHDARLQHNVVVIAMSLLIVVLAYLILRELASIFSPLMVALFICYLIVPAHRWLVRHHIPSLLSYVVLVLTFVVVMYGVGSMTYRSIAQMSRELPGYVTKLQGILEDTRLKLQAALADLGDFSHGDADASADDAESASEPVPTSTADTDLAPESEASPAAASPPAASEPEPQTPWQPIAQARLLRLAQATLETFLSFFTGALVIVFYLIFLLAEQAGFRGRVVHAFGEARATTIMAVIGEINAAVARYLTVKTLVSLLIGFLTFVILMLFGVEYALLWGILTFFANFIPYIGSIVAVMLPIAMSVVQFGDWWHPVAVGVLLTAAQQAVGSILEPRLIGRQLGVSPLVILLSLAFWGMLWGISGMILSAPLVVSAKIVLDHIESTRPIARLCSNV